MSKIHKNQIHMSEVITDQTIWKCAWAKTAPLEYEEAKDPVYFDIKVWWSVSATGLDYEKR